MNLKIKKACVIKELKKRKLYDAFELFKEEKNSITYKLLQKTGKPPYECGFTIYLTLEEQYDGIEFFLWNEIPINQKEEIIEYCNELNIESNFTFCVFDDSIILQTYQYNSRFFDEKDFLDLMIEMYDELQHNYISILKLLEE